MSIHSDLMIAGTDLLVAVQGNTGAAAPVEYRAPGVASFRWEGSSVGAQAGGVLPTDDGSFLKVARLPVQGPTAGMLAAGVARLDRQAVVTALGLDWSVDLDDSHFGPSMVRLMLYRRAISQFDDRTAGTEK
jgi:hypothetical protein